MDGLRQIVARAGIAVPALVWGLLWVAAAWAQPLSLGSARVVNAPAQFSYRIEQTRFSQPRNISTGAGAEQRQEIVRVIVRGQGFRPRATGPVVWLNGIATLRTQVAADGSSLQADFLESVPELEAAAARLGRWQLIVQPHEGAREALLVSPSGHPADAGTRPSVTSKTE